MGIYSKHTGIKRSKTSNGFNLVGRPRCLYKIGFCLKSRQFKPEGACKTTGVVEITPAEAEALRLKHVKGLGQTAAAAKMKVSQSTFQRILAAAHEKVSEAIIGGKFIKIIEQK